jgi:hypothetical protein
VCRTTGALSSLPSHDVQAAVLTDLCSYFKQNCPNAYAYAYDESSESALFTCKSSDEASFTVSFCP